MSKSSPISQEKLNYKRTLKKIERNHQQSISKTKEDQELQKIQLKDAGLIELENIRDENDQKIANEIKRKEDVLAKMKEGLEISKNTVDKQKEQYIEQQKNSLDNQKANYSLKFQEQDIKNKAALSKLNNRYMSKISETTRQGERELKLMGDTQKRLKRSKEKNFQLKMNDVARKQKQKYEFSEKQHTRALENLEDQFNKNLTQTKKNHHHEMKTHKDQYKKNMETVKERHHSQIKQTKESFDIKYKNQMANNDKTLNNLKDKTQKYLDEVQKQFKHDLKVELSQSEDSFYHTRKITPQIKDNPDHFEITFDVPEHEVAKTQLTGHEKTMKLSLNRKFVQKSQEGQDITSKVNKVESHTVEFKVPDFINNKEISSSFKDGKLTYKVSKKA